MSRFDPYDHIDEYLRGELKGEDLEDFEKELRHSDSLKDKIESARRAHEILDIHAREQMKERISQLDRRQPGRLRHFAPKKILLAAASLILMAVIWSFLFSYFSLTNEKLYSEYFSEYSDKLTTMGRDELSLQNAMREYNSGFYEEALNYFAMIRDSEKHAEDARFYSAMCHFYLENDSKAENSLKMILSTDTKYSEAARWYLSLLYLRTEKIDACLSLLDEIRESSVSHYKHKEAIDLANKLRSPFRKLL